MSNRVRLEQLVISESVGIHKNKEVAFLLIDDFSEHFARPDLTGKVIPSDDVELLAFVLDYMDSGDMEDLKDYLSSNGGHGMEIRGAFYEWDEIREVICPPHDCDGAFDDDEEGDEDEDDEACLLEDDEINDDDA